MTTTAGNQFNNTIKRSITFGLIQTAEKGNIGSAARALGVFGFSNLLLIEPLYQGLANDLTLAVGTGADILQNARRITAAEAPAVLTEFDEVWGTSSRQGHRRRNEIASDVITSRLNTLSGRLLILFGPERDGLSLDWLDCCHRLLHLPTSGGSLNLAQAVNIIAYEIQKQLLEITPEGELAPPVNTLCPGDSDRDTKHENHPASNQEIEDLPVPQAMRREIITRVDRLLLTLSYPTRTLPGHPPEIYLEPLRSGNITHHQAKWLLGLLVRLEKGLAPDGGSVGSSDNS